MRFVTATARRGQAPGGRSRAGGRRRRRSAARQAPPQTRPPPTCGRQYAAAGVSARPGACRRGGAPPGPACRLVRRAGVRAGRRCVRVSEAVARRSATCSPGLARVGDNPCHEAAARTCRCQADSSAGSCGNGAPPLAAGVPARLLPLRRAGFHRRRKRGPAANVSVRPQPPASLAAQRGEGRERGLAKRRPDGARSLPPAP